MNEFHRIWVNSVPSLKKPLDSVHKIDALLNCDAFQQTGWKSAQICGVRSSSDPL